MNLNTIWSTFNTELNSIMTGELTLALSLSLGLVFLIAAYFIIVGVLNRSPNFGDFSGDKRK